MPEFAELLQPYRESIEDLYVDLFEKWDWNRHQGAFPSLREFTALKSFNTNIGTWGDLLFAPAELDNHDMPDRLYELNITLLNDDDEKLIDRLPPDLTSRVIQQLEFMVGHEAWDFRQLEHLIAKRHERLPRLRSIVYVEWEDGYFEAPFEPFRFIIERANNNNDGFVFTISSLYDHRRAYLSAFLTYKNKPRSAEDFTRWKGDRYVSESGGRR